MQIPDVQFGILNTLYCFLCFLSQKPNISFPQSGIQRGWVRSSSTVEQCFKPLSLVVAWKTIGKKIAFRYLNLVFSLSIMLMNLRSLFFLLLMFNHNPMEDCWMGGGQLVLQLLNGTERECLVFCGQIVIFPNISMLTHQ